MGCSDYSSNLIFFILIAAFRPCLSGIWAEQLLLFLCGSRSCQPALPCCQQPLLFSQKAPVALSCECGARFLTSFSSLASSSVHGWPRLSAQRLCPDRNLCWWTGSIPPVAQRCVAAYRNASEIHIIDGLAGVLGNVRSQHSSEKGPFDTFEEHSDGNFHF